MAFFAKRPSWRLAALAGIFLLSVFSLPAPALSVPEVTARYFPSGAFVSIYALPGGSGVEVWLNASQSPALVVRARDLPNGVVERVVETRVEALREAGAQWLDVLADRPSAQSERDSFRNASSALVARAKDCARGVSVFLGHPNSVAYRNLVIEKNLHRKDEWAALLVLNETRGNFTLATEAFENASGAVSGPYGSNASRTRAMGLALSREFVTFNQTLLVMSKAQAVVRAAYFRSFDEGLDVHTCALNATESRALNDLARLRVSLGSRTVDAFVASVTRVLAGARQELPSPTVAVQPSATPSPSQAAPDPAALSLPREPDAPALALAGILALGFGSLAGWLARRARAPPVQPPQNP